MANKKGTGVAIIRADVPPEHVAEFNRRWNEELLAETLVIPGVLSGARYEAVKGGPKHMTVYELAEPFDIMGASISFDDALGVYNRRYNVYGMIHPSGLSDGIANSGMADYLQMSRMDVPAAGESAWNAWYSDIYVPNNEKVPGCIRGRRLKATLGEPRYATIYDLENEHVSASPAWAGQWDAHPDNDRMRELMTLAEGSPGIWRKTYQL